MTRVRAIERVALVVPTVGRGGAERVVSHLARSFAHRGVEPLCICLEARGLLGEALAADGLPVISLASRRRLDVPALACLAKAIREFRPSVVNVHAYSCLPYVVGASVLTRRWPLVFTAHGLLYDSSYARLRRRHRLFARRVDRMIAVSGQVADRHREYLGWRGEIDVVPNGVPDARLDPAGRARVREEMGISPETFVFLAVGNVKPEKDYENLLHAASELRRGGADFAVFVAGELLDTPYRRGVMDKHKQLGLESVVRFMGFREDTQALYAAADALVLPSRSEGMPMVMLEAMMCGLPVVATRAGGIPNVLDDGAGLLVDIESPAQLSAAMARLMATPTLRAELAETARRRAAAEYGVDTMAGRYLEVFGRASAGR